MAITVQALANDVLTYIGVTAAGETPNSDDSNLLLRMLNRLVGSWSAEEIAMLGLGTISITLTGAASYAVTTTQRPLRILAASVVAANGTTMPVKVSMAPEFDAIPDKTRTGIFIENLFYDTGYPTGNIYVTPKPAAGTLQLRAYVAITAFSALSDSVDFPVGYERAIIENLSVMAAPIWGKMVPQSLAAMAAESKAIIKKLSDDVLGPTGMAPVLAQGAGQ